MNSSRRDDVECDDEDGEQEEAGGGFTVTTVQNGHGHNMGRAYTFRVGDDKRNKEWIKAINTAIESKLQHLESLHNATCLQRLQARCMRLHTNERFQLASGVLVFISFILSCVETEVRICGSEQRPCTGPEESSTYVHQYIQLSPTAAQRYEDAFDILNLSFTCIFACEVFISAFAYGFPGFLKNFWTVFDLFIVTVGLLSYIEKGIPAFNALRLIRIFRAVKLLQHAPQLQRIITALRSAIWPVCNSFVLFGFVAMIYAVLGVHLFGDSINQDGEFETFFQSLFTMYQVSTGDDWSGMARVLHDNAGRRVSFQAGLFFTTFQLSAGCVLMNIVVAVLLDEFLNTMGKLRAQEEAQVAFQRASEADRDPLDPLYQGLVRYRTPRELTVHIRGLFNRLDVDCSGRLSFDEVVRGLRRLPVFKTTGFNFLQEDWEGMVSGMVQDSLSVTEEEFHAVLQHQLRLYVFRRLHRTALTNDRREESTLLALQWLLYQQICPPGKTEFLSESFNRTPPLTPSTNVGPNNEHGVHQHGDHQGDEHGDAKSNEGGERDSAKGGGGGGGSSEVLTAMEESHVRVDKGVKQVCAAGCCLYSIFVCVCVCVCVCGCVCVHIYVGVS